ncbi:MAG TPA: isochorismatase family protein [Actinomycetota bacterium]|nr:isochorismatase family protein [Actinomycetota bacterium]
MVQYDEKTAVIVVDVQNDFADPKGNLHVKDGSSTIPVVNREVDRALSAGGTVFYTQDWHPESTPHFEKDGGIWPVHCVMDSWGAKLHPDLAVEGEIVRKGSHGEDGYSGFSQRDPVSGEETPTALEQKLRDKGIEKVVVVGLATDYCVKATALDAIQRGFEVTVLSDGVRAVDLQPGDGDRALKEIKDAGGKVT